MLHRRTVLVAGLALAALTATRAAGQSVVGRDTYRRIKAAVDAVQAIDTHDHLHPFAQIMAEMAIETDRGRGMTLASLWRKGYYPQVGDVAERKPGETFDAWWPRARHDFDDARATGFYRYNLPAFRDLYGVDFDRITDDQARALDARIFDNYRDDRWIGEVVKRAGIALMVNDPYWGRFDFRPTYPFEVQALNVSTLIDAHDPSVHEQKPSNDPYRFAREQQVDVKTLDDYVALLDRLLAHAKAAGAICLKSTRAYDRTLHFEKVPRERAARAFGKARRAVSPEERKDFEDYVMWRLVELSAKHDLPFQIHTGHGRLQGSNPMLLLDLIEANPQTKFILFHGGYPWVGETGAIALRHWRHVWVDSVWLPTISPTLARRAFHEWLEVMPSSRLLWGADCHHAEGIYGATVVMRQTLAEVLAESVDRGDLAEEHAIRIARQVLRENALSLFPQLRARLGGGG